MRTISFNKAKMAICLRCKTNPVPADRAMRPCRECTTKTSTNGGVIMGKRQPAAVIKTEDGKEIFVDKSGKEVRNPGYDLKKDPRGWDHTGTRPKSRSVIK